MTDKKNDKIQDMDVDLLSAPTSSSCRHSLPITGWLRFQTMVSPPE